MRKALLWMRENRGARMEWQRKERENIEELSSEDFTLQHTKQKRNKLKTKQQASSSSLYMTTPQAETKSAKSLSASTHTLQYICLD